MFERDLFHCWCLVSYRLLAASWESVYIMHMWGCHYVVITSSIIDWWPYGVAENTATGVGGPRKRRTVFISVFSVYCSDVICVVRRIKSPATRLFSNNFFSILANKTSLLILCGWNPPETGRTRADSTHKVSVIRKPSICQDMVMTPQQLFEFYALVS